MQRQFANLPLHGGKAPHWLFHRMRRLAGCIAEAMVMELGPAAFLERISDPFWFQCLGCVLGFDWHSSGLTTTTCGALKEGISGRERDLGLYIAGGKGAASRKTPGQILEYSEGAGTDGDKLVYASRLSAKVDSSAVQDGYQVYHHCFFFTADGTWAVVQQGMNEESGWARRYHWLSHAMESFVCEPHKAVCSDSRGNTLNLVAKESADSRQATTEMSRQPPDKLLRELRRIVTGDALDLPGRHGIHPGEDIHPDRMKNILIKTFERQPENFETLLGMEGVGPKTIRALSLVGELMYGARPSFRDPARYSFAHGGKDGIPYPVDRATYDLTAGILERAVSEAKVESKEKLQALRRMAAFLAT